MSRQLYITYNADASFMGKLNYGYRKICKPANACAACDLTHGGLSLSETPQWTQAKGDIERDGNLRISQLHRDEVKEPLKSWLVQNGVKWPAVVMSKSKEDGHESLELLLAREDLAQCKGDTKVLVQMLRDKGVFQEQASL